MMLRCQALDRNCLVKERVASVDMGNITHDLCVFSLMYIYVYMYIIISTGAGFLPSTVWLVALGSPRYVATNSITWSQFLNCLPKFL